MERDWFVNSSLSRSEGGTAVESERSYQISPIVLASSPALLQGRRSTTPHGFDKERVCACSIVITLLHSWPREHSWMLSMGSGENADRKRQFTFGGDPLMFFDGTLDAVARVAGISVRGRNEMTNFVGTHG